MADIEADIRTLLLDVSAITTLVPAQTIGSVEYGAIFAGFAVKNFREPYVVINERDNDPMTCFDGTYGMEESIIEIGVHAKSRKSARAIARAVRAYFDDFTGVAGESQIHQVLLSSTTTDNTIADGSDERIHSVLMTFTVQHEPD